MHDKPTEQRPPISTDRQCQMIARLAELIKTRATGEQQIEADFAEKSAACKQQFEMACEQLTGAHEEETEALNAKYLTRLETARLSYEADSRRAEEQRDQDLSEAQARHRAGLDAAELAVQQAHELAGANFDQDTQLAESVAAQARATAANTAEQFAWLQSQGATLLRRRGVQLDQPQPSAVGEHAATATLLAQYGEAAKQAHQQIQEFARWKSVKYCDEGWPLLVFFFVLATSGGVSAWKFGWNSWQWAVGNLLLAAVVAVGSWRFVEAYVRRTGAQTIRQIKDTLHLASKRLQHALTMVDIEQAERRRQLQARRDKQENQATTTFQTTKSELDQQLADAEAVTANTCQDQLAAAQQQWDETAAENRNRFPPLIEEKTNAYQLALSRLEDDRDAALERFAAEYNTRWDQLISTWRAGIANTFAEVDAMNQFCQAEFPAWAEVDWPQWSPKNQTLPALPLGRYEVDLNSFEGGLSDVEQLKIDREQLTVPAVLAFPQSPSLLIEAEHEGRDAAVAVMQNTMLRLLTSLPAGKVRFTIIDPTGLGQNFSAFMHLADYDDRLVASRIWTEASTSTSGWPI